MGIMTVILDLRLRASCASPSSSTVGIHLVYLVAVLGLQIISKHTLIHDFIGERYGKSISSLRTKANADGRPIARTIRETESPSMYTKKQADDAKGWTSTFWAYLRKCSSVASSSGYALGTGRVRSVSLFSRHAVSSNEQRMEPLVFVWVADEDSEHENVKDEKDEFATEIRHAGEDDGGEGDRLDKTCPGMHIGATECKEEERTNATRPRFPTSTSQASGLYLVLVLSVGTAPRKRISNPFVLACAHQHFLPALPSHALVAPRLHSLVDLSHLSTLYSICADFHATPKASDYQNDGEGFIYNVAFVEQTEIEHFIGSPRNAQNIQRLLAATTMKLGYTKHLTHCQTMYKPCTRSGAYSAFWMGHYYVEKRIFNEAYLHQVLEHFNLPRVPFLCECGTMHRKFHRFPGSTHWNQVLGGGLRSLGVKASKIWLHPTSSSVSPDVRDAYETIYKS
ncbi:hypothetical protein R3P38DRAFT_3227304 [Favolaschia claudopus]|uniref:Uncharacterized protein n=1 Tax=Favolaschia claudopus TaxID=2862362 RepID=A0AAV9ZSZ1_9AGAR